MDYFSVALVKNAQGRFEGFGIVEVSKVDNKRASDHLCSSTKI